MAGLSISPQQLSEQRVRYVWIRLLAFAAIALCSAAVLKMAADPGATPSTGADPSALRAVAAQVPAARAADARVLLGKRNPDEGLVCRRGATAIAVVKRGGHWQQFAGAVPRWARLLARRC